MTFFCKTARLAFGFFLLFSLPAKADCIQPDGPMGTIVFNESCKVMQYCDGENWTIFGMKLPDCDYAPVWQTASGTVATIETNAALSMIVTATDDKDAVVYSKQSGDGWISVNSATGELSGTAPGSSGTYSITVRASDTEGHYTDRTFSVAVSVPSDTTPDAFSFTDVADAALSTQILSDIVQISGMDAPAPVTIFGGAAEFRICSVSDCGSVVQDWGGANQTITNGQYVQLRLTSSASYSAVSSAILDIGGVADQWNVTTQADPGPPSGCPNIGDLCDDGSYYAGLSPDGNAPFYITDVSFEALKYGNDGSANWLDTPVTNCTSGGGEASCITGQANTESWAAGDDGQHYDSATTNGSCAGLAGAGDACQSIHEAADYCAALSAHTRTDWYLPSIAELDIVYVNLVGPDDPDNPVSPPVDVAGEGDSSRAGPLAGSFLTTSYWSSSEFSDYGAWRVRFSDGAMYKNNKNNQYNVRCIRKPPYTPPDTTPDAFSFTDVADVALSTVTLSDIVQIAGLDTAAAITVSGHASAEYRVCADATCSTGPAWTSTAGTIANNEYVQLRLTSSASLNATVSATLDIGGVSDQWDATTFVTDPCAGTPVAGDQCADGSIYIGEHPTESGVQLYATSQSQSTGIQWGPWGTDSGADSHTNGWANQEWIRLNATIASYPAANLCHTLDRHGAQDWYLPALAELDFMYKQLVCPGDTNNPTDPNSGGGGSAGCSSRNGAWAATFATGYHWSSTESSVGNSWVEQFSDGYQSNGSKDNTSYDVRCIRRVAPDTTPDAFSFGDQTDVAVGTATLSNIVQITGLDAAATISVSGDASAEYRICTDATCTSGPAWTSTAGTIANNEYAQLRLTSSASLNATVSATLDVGGVNDQWDVTTVATDPCAGTPSPGDQCADGRVYAGLSPDGNGAAYVTSAAYEADDLAWNDDTANYVDTPLINCTDGGSQITCVSGEANTEALADGDDGLYYDSSSEAGQQQHEAAEYCADLSAHGFDDWYLPARDEIALLWNGGSPIGGVLETGTWYWTSSEITGSNVWIIKFNTGELNNYSKGNNYQVRCMRRDGVPDTTPDAFSFTDATDVALSTATVSNILQISGLNSITEISIAGDGSPQYRICTDATCSAGPAWTSTAGTINNNQYVQVRLTSSASNATTVSATLDIGGVTDQWNVTTQSGQIVFDFENDNLFTGGDTGIFSHGTAGVKNGTYGITSASNTSHRSVYTTSCKLNAADSPKVSAWIRPYAEGDSIGASASGILVGTDGTDGNKETSDKGLYAVLELRNGGTISMRRDFDYLTETVFAVPLVSGTWYWMEVTWTTSGIDVALYDSPGGSLIGSGSYSDSTYSSGFIGVGSYGKGDFDDITVQGDCGFEFPDKTDVSLSAVIESDILGIFKGDGKMVSVSGGGSPEFRICLNADCSSVIQNWGSASQTINHEQYIQVRLTSSASNSTTLSATLTIDTSSQQWDVTTEAAAPSGPTGCPNPGDQCDAPNDFYYAGLSPDGDVPFYVTSPAYEITEDWNDGTSNWNDTPLTNCTSGGAEVTCKTGKANTEALAAGDDNLHYDSATTNGTCSGLAAAGDACQSIHEAADYCADLVAHGKDDWYLPSIAELDVMYVNLVCPGDPNNPTWADGAGGGSGSCPTRNGPLAGSFQTAYYWSSSELHYFRVWAQGFNDGYQTYGGKSNNSYVRCVRR